MFLHRVNKANKRIITCNLCGMVILAMLLSTASLAFAQEDSTPVPFQVVTETTVPASEGTQEPVVEPTQIMEITGEPNITDEPGQVITPEPAPAATESKSDLPNLLFSAPEGWDAPVLFSLQQDSHTGDVLTHGEQEYFDLAIYNSGADINTPFSICLKIDNEQLNCWDVPDLTSGEYFLVEDWPYTADRGDGSHYVEVTADAAETITESDESDNIWSYDFYWQISNLEAQSEGSPLINDAFPRPYIPEMGDQSADGSNAPGYADTSAFMIGSVVVAVILPESIGSTENWTQEEEIQINNEIQEGLRRWAEGSNSSGDFINKDQAAANVNFILGFPNPVSTSYEPIADVGPTLDNCLWISEVLANMGFNNPEGCIYQVYDYLAALRAGYQTDWATIIFVVDSSADTDGVFNDGYFGYAYLNGPFTVMTYDNGGWGIDRMDKVVQHEMGHIFGAGDNYYQFGYGGCTSTTEQYGYLGIPNSNCAYGNPNAVTDVLMNNNTINRNHWTAQYQVGWRDRDNDRIPDIVDTQPIFTMNGVDTDLTVSGVVNDPPLTASNYYATDVTINRIASARYRIDDGDWIAISASDGNFDSDYEEISFSLSEMGYGPHTLSVEVTNSSGNSSISNFDLKLPNDRMTTPTTMKVDTAYSANTRWSGVTPDEPQNVCNEDDTRSVWYKFYAPTKGIYKLDASGSSYSPNLTVVKKGSGTAFTPLVCGDTETSNASTSSLSFNAAAGATYLIGVSSDSEENWDLSLKINKLTCPANNLCGAAIGGDNRVLHYPVTTILQKNGERLNYSKGDYSGFNSTYLGSNGYFKVVTAGGSSLIVQENVQIPGIYLPSAKGLPKTEIKVLDTSGTEIASDEIVVFSSGNKQIYGTMHGTALGESLNLYAPAGSYNLFAVSDTSGLFVYKPGITIVSSTNPGSVTMDASDLYQDEFSFTLDGISAGTICFYSPEESGLCMDGSTNRNVSFAAPQNTAITNMIYLIDAADASNNQWRYNLRLSGLAEDSYIHGDYTHSFQVGGALKVSPYLNNDPIRLDEGRGYIFPGVTDFYDHPVNGIYFTGDSSYFGSPANTEETPVDDSNLIVQNDEESSLLNLPNSIPSDINSQSLIFKNIGPSFSVTDPAGNVIKTGSVSNTNGSLLMPFSLTDPAGTWTITETLDAGPRGGTVIGSKISQPIR